MTQPVGWLEKPFEGYVMNTVFSEENSATVMELIDKISQAFGDSVHCMTAESLHITLLDWIAPLVDYAGKDKHELFKAIYHEYDTAVGDILSGEKQFTVTFDTIHVAPTTIFISGHDNGEFERIRSKYLDAVQLLPDTKRPPAIIHSSLARFKKELDLAEVESVIKQQSIGFEQSIENFQLVHTFKEPMLEFEILKTYNLLVPAAEGNEARKYDRN